jgi:hypothetical protein
MIDWILVAGVICMSLVATVIVLALCRTIATIRDKKLTRAGLGATNPLHVHLRHTIESEDRMGIALTITAFICSAIVIFMLASQIVLVIIHKLVQILTLQ